MKMTLQDNLISLKDLARSMEELKPAGGFTKTYAALRRRVARNYYKTYVKIKGEGFVNITDNAIPDNLQLLIKNKLSNTTINNPDTHATVIADELSPEEEKYSLAKANIIKMYLEYLVKFGKDNGTRKRFVDLYNHKAFPEQFAQVGKIGSWKTIETWKREYLNNNYDYRVLARKKISRSSSVPPEQSEVIIKLALNPNRPLLSEVVRMAMEIFEMKRHPRILSPTTYRRFIDNWKDEHYADWVFFREGEQALDNKILPFLERDYNKIGVGDILIMDGHVNNYEILNPATGKPKRMITVGALDMYSNYLCGYEISPTENTFAIAVAVRRAILTLGKIPKIIYFDNGRAFGAKYFHGDDMTNIEALFQRLNIKVIFAKAYHGQSKTIEPFWDWMAELERLMPTYVGTSIEMQPPRLNRGEKLHVKLYEKMMFGTSIDLFTAHKAMAWWLNRYHTRPQQQGHLKGLSPAEVFDAGKGQGINKQELTFLMMQQEIKNIYRNGIKMLNGTYWNEALFGRKWDDVLVRYDLLETDSIFVYDKAGQFICEAKRMDKVHPAAGILGTEEDVKLLHEQLARKEHLKKSVVGDAKQFLKEEIYPSLKKQFEANVINLQNEPPEQIDEIQNKKSKKKKSLSARWGLDDNKKAQEG